MKPSNKTPNAAVIAGLGALAAGAALFAAKYPTIAAAIGSAELSVLGVPQLLKNFREHDAAKDLSLETTLIWFFVAFFLSLVSWMRESSVWYILLNIAGTVESAALLAQINFYARADGAARKSAFSVIAAAAAGFIALRGFFVTQAEWACLLFPAAMALLIVMNIPQIVKNYELYREEGAAPDGITPYYPALVVSGSYLQLIAAMKFGDFFWAINSLIAVMSASLILGQILLPGVTNLVLEKIMELRRLWSSEWA